MQAIFGYLGENAKHNFSHMNYFPNKEYSYGEFLSPTLAMGARRIPVLKDIQVAQCSSDEKNQIRAVMLGEIFNTRDLLEKLRQKGHHMLSGKDTDIIVHLYKEFGLEMFKMLDGLYSIALWDEKSRKIIVSVDRYGGIHRCYFIAKADFFAFSSSVKHLLAIPAFERAVNPKILARFFTTGHIIPPETSFQDIQQLPPGYAVIYQNGSFKLELVDGFQFTKNRTASTEEFYHIFEQSMRARLESDRKKALLLSGGLDSSCNVAMASTLAGSTLKTITAKIAHGNLDESNFANIMAQHCRTSHHEFTPDMDRALDPLPQIAFWFEEPFMDTSAVPVYHVFNDAKNIVQLLISGDGPDHLFGRHYPLASRRKFFRTVLFLTDLPFLLRPISNNGLSSNRRLAALQKVWRIGFLPLQQAYIDRYMQPTWHTMGGKGMLPFFGTALKKELETTFEPLLAADGKLDWFNHLTMVDYHIDGSFGVFEKIGRMANGFNLVVREPYLQRDVTNFIFGLPRKLRVGGRFIDLMRTRGQKKLFLRKAVGERLLPARTLKKSKAGFLSPTDFWIRKAIGQKQPKDVLCSELIKAEFFNLSFLNRIFDEHRTEKRQWGRLIYNLIFTDIWYRTFILGNGQKPLGVTLENLWTKTG
ncbi:hypothetical protein JW935_08220 [candidate division KSB1 bacterium]|nr:hypothetical protein [candidate division KSB1 bacterium]